MRSVASKKLTFLLFACALSGLLLPACTQEKTHSLNGVWKVTKIVNLDENSETDPGNMHYIVTDSFIMTIGGKEERPVIDKNFANMTPEEILSQLPAGGGFMDYEVKDGKIHRTTRYALSEYFEGKLIVTEYEVTEDTLVFRDDHHADGQLREWHMLRLE